MERETKDSGVPWIGEIPANWQLSRIKYIAEFEPKTDFSKLNPDDTITYTPMDCIKNGYYVPNTALFGSLSPSLTSYQENDIVMAKVTPCFENGNISVMQNLSSGVGLGSSELFVFRAKGISTRFLFYWLQNSAFVEQAKSTMTGTGGLKRVSPQYVKNCEIHLPPPEEQTRIASFLDAECSRIDTVIEKTRSSIEEYKKLKQAVITQAVTKGIRPDRPMKNSGIEWIGEIPEEWEMSTIGKNVHFEGGSQPPLTQFIHEPQEGYVRLIQNRDYKTDAYITYVPINSVSKFCGKEDVMIGRYGPPMFVMHRGLEGAYNVALMKAIPQGIDREWMSFVLREYTLLRYVESFSKRAAGQDGVNPQILKKYPLPLPANKEQKEIAAFLNSKTSEIDTLIKKKESLISELERYKQTIIYEYVTGKKEVPA